MSSVANRMEPTSQQTGLVRLVVVYACEIVNGKITFKKPTPAEAQHAMRVVETEEETDQ